MAEGDNANTGTGDKGATTSSTMVDKTAQAATADAGTPAAKGADTGKPAAGADGGAAAAAAAKAESDARVAALGAAKSVDDKKAAYAALTDAEKKAAFDAMPEEDRKALGLKDPGAAKDGADKGKGDAGAVDYAKIIAEVALPEGMTLDEGAAKGATELFGKHKVSPEAAKEYVSFHVEQLKAVAERSAQAWHDQQKTWKAEVEADKSLTPEVRAAAKAALLRFADKETVKLLEGYGFTNNRGVIQAFANIGKAIKDDQTVPGNAARANGRGDARTFYPNSNMNP